MLMTFQISVMFGQGPAEADQAARDPFCEAWCKGGSSGIIFPFLVIKGWGARKDAWFGHLHAEGLKSHVESQNENMVPQCSSTVSYRAKTWRAAGP